MITVLAVSIKPQTIDDLLATAYLILHFSAIGDEATCIALASMAANRAALAERYIEKFGHPHPVYGDGSWRQACVEVDLDLVDESRPVSRAYVKAMESVLLVVAGKTGDPVRGATRCHRHDAEPLWAASAMPRAIVKEFIFYRTCEK